MADRMMSGESEVVSQDMQVFATQIGNQLGLLCVLAAVIGLGLLLRERKTRWIACTLAAMAALDGIYGSWINPMGLVDFQNGVPLLMVACACAGFAVAAFARSTGPAARYVGSFAALALVLPPALVTVPALGEVADLPREISEEALRTSSANAVLFTQSESVSSGALYLSSVEGARPDLAVVVWPMLADTERVATELRRSGTTGYQEPEQPELVLATIAKTGRRMFWETGAIPTPQGSFLRHGALVSELVDQEDASGSLRENLRRLRTIFHGPGRRERVARRTLAAALTNMGQAALSRGDTDFALELFEAALEIRPEQASGRAKVAALEGR
jgi:hypothetical protein